LWSHRESGYRIKVKVSIDDRLNLFSASSGILRVLGEYFEDLVHTGLHDCLRIPGRYSLWDPQTKTNHQDENFENETFAHQSNL